MGATVSNLLKRLSGKKEFRIVMLGLYEPGKTTILYKLKCDEIVRTMPTIGFNVETLEYKNTFLVIWDVGGGDKIRLLWRHYFDDHTNGLIYVVDSTNREYMADAGEELANLLQLDKLKDIVLLVLANKTDLPNAMSVAEITDELGLNLLQGRRWHIQSTCAINGHGLHEGLNWLISEFTKNQENHS